MTTRVYIDRDRQANERNFFMRSPRVTKQLDRPQKFQELAAENLTSARVICVLEQTRGGQQRVAKITFVADSTLNRGELNMRELPNGRVEKIYTLHGFEGEVRRLGHEGSLPIDFTTGQRLQNIFHAKSEEKSLWLEKHIERRIRAEIHRSSRVFDREAFFLTLRPFIRDGQHPLPFKNALELYRRFFPENDPSRVGASERIGLEKLLQCYGELNQLTANSDYLNSDEILKNPHFFPLLAMDIQAGLNLPFYCMLTPEGAASFIAIAFNEHIDSANARLGQIISNLAHLMKSHMQISDEDTLDILGGRLIDASLKMTPDACEHFFKVLRDMDNNGQLFKVGEQSLLTHFSNRVGLQLLEKNPLEEVEVVILAHAALQMSGPDQKRVLKKIQGQGREAVTLALRKLPFLSFKERNEEKVYFAKELALEVYESRVGTTASQEVSPEDTEVMLYACRFLPDEKTFDLIPTLLKQPRREFVQLLGRLDLFPVKLQVFKFVTRGPEKEAKYIRGLDSSLVFLTFELVVTSYKILNGERLMGRYGKILHDNFTRIFYFMDPAQRREMIPQILGYDFDRDVIASFVRKVFFEGGFNEKIPVDELQQTTEEVVKEGEKLTQSDAASEAASASKSSKPKMKRVFCSLQPQMEEFLVKEYVPQNRREIYLLSYLFSLVGPSESVLTQKLMELPNPGLILGLEPREMKLWEKSSRFSRMFQMKMRASGLTRHYIPNIPVDDASVRTQAHLEEVLLSKGLNESLRRNIALLWNKTVSAGERGLQRIMKKTLFKAIELNAAGSISDEAFRVFLSNIQHEHRVCWPGLCQKLQKEFRGMSLHLLGSHLPQELRAQNHADALRGRVESYLEGSCEESYQAIQPWAQKHQKTIQGIAGCLLSEGMSHQTKVKLVADLVEMYRKENAQELSSAVKEEIGDRHEMTIRQFNIFYLLNQNHEGLTPKDLLEKLGIRLPPAFLKQMMRPLITKELVHEVEGKYILNTENPKVQAVQARIGEAIDQKADELDPTAGLKHALRLECEETRALRRAMQADVKQEMKLNLVLISNRFFEAWVDANKCSIQYALVKRYMREASRTGIELFHHTDEARVKLLCSDRYLENNIVDPDQNMVHVRRILSRGNEVHLLAAAKQAYCSQLGLNPQSAREDRYARQLLYLFEESGNDFGFRAANWPVRPFLTDQMALLNFFAEELNATAPSVSDNIEGYFDFYLIIQSHLEETVTDGALRDKLLGSSFAEESEGIKPRLTALGVNFLLQAKGIGLLQTLRSG